MHITSTKPRQKWLKLGVDMIPVPHCPTTDRLQVLLSLITHCQVKLRQPRFTTACLVSHSHRDAVANFWTIQKSATAPTAIKSCHGYPSRPPRLSHVHPVVSTVAGNSIAVVAGNIV